MPKIKSISFFTEKVEREVFDIDSDFSFNPITGEDKNTIIRWLEKKFNSRDSIHVAYVGNKNIYSSKSAIRDVASVFEVPSSETFACTKLYDDDMTPEENVKRNAKIREYFEKYPQVLEFFPKLIGTISNFSIHAGGVIISDKKYPLNEYCALQKTREDSGVATMFDKDELQKSMGFVKLDILQVTALSQVAYVKHLVGDENLYEDYPYEEEVIKTVTSRGWHKNIFQFESDLGKRCFAELPMATIDDISNASGIIRILGTQGGRNAYATYRDNATKFFAGDTRVWSNRLRLEVKNSENFQICKQVLEKTYGVMIYQEQLSKLVELLSRGQRTFSDGNQCRKKLEGLVKKYGLVDNITSRKTLKDWHTDIMAILNQYLIPFIQDELDDSCKSFINFEMRDNSIVIPQTGIMNWFIVSGTYLFSRVHDIAYSILSYNQMYQKYYYPREFWTSALFCNGKTSIYGFYSAMRQEGQVTLLPPSVNLSGVRFQPEGENSIRYGLSDIMGMDKAGEAIVMEREESGLFKNFEDFLDRMSHYQVFNKKTVENMIFSNALAEFGEMPALMDQYYARRKETHSYDFNANKNVKREFEVLNVNLSFKSKASQEAQRYSPVSTLSDGAIRQCCIVVKKITPKKTKNGKDYTLLSAQCLNKETTHNIFVWDDSLKFEKNSSYVVTLQRRGDFISVKT